jgi:ferredoxin
MWRLDVDRAACRSAGVCIGIAGGHFEVDADGRSRPRAELVRPDDAVLDAALGCPMEAIRVLDTRTGRVLAPDPAGQS